MVLLEWFGALKPFEGSRKGRDGAKQNDLVSQLIFSRSESSSPRRERKKSSKKKKHRYEVGVHGVFGEA